MGQQNRGWWIALLALVLVVLLLPTLAGGAIGSGMMGPGTMGSGMMGMMGQWGDEAVPGAGGWAMGLSIGLGILGMLAFWGAVIAAIFLVVRALTRPASEGAGPRAASALDILKRRYAAGEITHDQYVEMRSAVEH